MTKEKTKRGEKMTKEKIEEKISGTTIPLKGSNSMTIGGVAVQTIRVRIQGISSLICHRFSEKQQKKMLEKQMKTAHASPGRETKNPHQDYLDSLYVMPDKRYGFPVSGFKKSLVAASRFTGMKGTEIKGALHVMEEPGCNGLVPIEKVQPQMREDIVRLGGMSNPPDIRFRGEFLPGWEVNLLIRYNMNAISAEQIVQLIDAAGFGIGIGDWRPSSPKGSGPHGMFKAVGRMEVVS